MMRESVASGCEIVLGYAPFYPDDGPFFRYEVAYTAFQYGALAVWGLPYMGVGRNLAWEKALFDRQNGFEAHRELASGDDDLFVNAAANARNTVLCLQPQAFAYSRAPKGWREWLLQKRRHLSASHRYRLHHRLMLGAIALTHTLHYGLGLILLLTGGALPLVVCGYALRQLMAWPVATVLLTRLREYPLTFAFPFWDGLLAVWYGAVLPFLLWIPGPVGWKKR
jgi:hypothetical protein